MLLPFDAHNHVQLGTKLLPTSERFYSQLVADNGIVGKLSGMAIMSTHPRDFQAVMQLHNQGGHSSTVVPCFGIHPWFLHELTNDDWSPVLPSISSTATNAIEELPMWVCRMEEVLERCPAAAVGEIGLDGFHFDPITKDLTCPMEIQVKAFELQLSTATRMQRPVSIHCVRAMGPLMNSISNVQKQNKGLLPPSMYFHAFGGKLGTATQLVKSLEKKNATRVFFGFAPVINHQSPKTSQVLKEVGLNRLVLESDHEDPSIVVSSIHEGLKFATQVLGVSEQQVLEETNRNVMQLYGIFKP